MLRFFVEQSADFGLQLLRPDRLIHDLIHFDPGLLFRVRVAKDSPVAPATAVSRITGISGYSFLS